MKKIAIVIQRCGKEVLGGSEWYAFQMAKVLSNSYDVDILTTTAKDFITWKNYYEEGVEEITGKLKITRFGVDFEREIYWHELHMILFKGMDHGTFSEFDPETKEYYLKPIKSAPIGLAEEWVKHGGPYSSHLLNYIKENQDSYDKFLFMTCLYPTTYFGVDMVEDREKIFIVPTMHDEPAAYLSVFLKYSKYKFLFLTKAEKELASTIFRCGSDSDVIGVGMQDKSNGIENCNKHGKYILYAGRLEGEKGVDKLYDFFVRFSKKYPDIKLYTIGDGPLKNYKHKNVKYLGFVSEGEKISVMKNALAFIHPSAYESLGIALLEAFMVGTPALVNNRCQVLKEHVLNSQGGFTYDSYEDFEEGLLRIINDEILRETLSGNARGYFLNNYSLDVYRDKLLRILNK